MTCKFINTFQPLVISLVHLISQISKSQIDVTTVIAKNVNGLDQDT